MKKSILVLLLFSISVSANCQKYDIEFPNGEVKKVVFAYDDPSRVPKFQVEMNLFGFTTIKDASLIFQIKPVYILSDRIWFDGLLTMPYSRSLDGSIIGEIDKKKLSIDFVPQAHFKLWSKVKQKKRKLPISYKAGPEEGSTIVYVAKVPRKKAYALEFDAGFIFNRTNANSFYLESTIPQIEFIMNRYNSTSLLGGFSYKISESFKFNSNGITRRHWRSSRLFLDFTYAIAKNFIVHNYGSENEVTTGFIEPDFKPFGWRFGFDRVIGMNNSNFGIIYGFEVGANPEFSTFFDGRTERTLSSRGRISVGIIYGRMTK